MRADRVNLPATPCALAISGLDPSGGAGLFADLRAFAVAQVWGCGAPAVSTVQSTAGLRRSRAMPTRDLLAQVREIYAHQNVRSIKIGALGSSANARGILRWLRTVSGRVPVVLDPVMRPTLGSKGVRLLESAGLRVLFALAARATLVTPNIPEAELLVGMRIRSIEDAERAARALVSRGARAALVKGGHLRDPSAASKTVDVLVVGSRTIHISAARVGLAVHGTGCALASLIAGRLAAQSRIKTARVARRRASARRSGAQRAFVDPPRDGEVTDQMIVDAVRWAKNRLHRALSRPARIGAGLLVLPL